MNSETHFYKFGTKQAIKPQRAKTSRDVFYNIESVTRKPK